MKKMLLNLLVCFSLSTYALSPYDHSDLAIESHSGFITVRIDGQYFPQPTDHFYLEHMQPGNHKIEIFRTENYNYYGHTMPKKQKIFSGVVFIEGSSIVNAVIDPRNGFYVAHIDPKYANASYYEPYQPYSEIHPTVYAMPAASFSALLATVRDQWFDDTKKDIALQALQYNYLSTAQVTQLLHSFTFEDTKLSLAKAAYAKVTDPQNYFMVNDAFTFSSSVSELSDYILHYH